MAGEKPLILIADDEVHILHVLGLKLHNAGYLVVTAANGRDALEIARRERPSVIITDYQMPYVTGIELAEQLAIYPETRETPVLLLTARGASLTSAYLDQANITSVITKPFSPREVLARVQELVAQRVSPEWKEAS